MIIEEAKKIVVPRVTVKEKIHGHTTIDLFDTRTKRYERVEHDNHFTNGLESHLRDFGVFQNSPYANSTFTGRSAWKTLLGGVLLFDTALPTSPDAKYMPAGTTMIANGSFNVTNSSTPSELGSYNAVESSESNNSITMVYDWGTSGGNGTIASVALTTQTGGYIGYGNASLASATTLKNITENQTATPTNLNGSQYGAKRLYWNHHLYEAENGSYSPGVDTVVVKKAYIQDEYLDVFRTPADTDVANFETAYTFTLPEALDTYYNCIPVGDGLPSCFMLNLGGGQNVEEIPNGSTFKVYLLDVSDGSVEKIVVTNNIGATINTRYGFWFYILDDTYAIVALSLGGKWYKINYRTSAVIGEVTNGETSQIITSGLYLNRNNHVGANITPDLYSTGVESCCLYDPVLNRFLPTNGYMTMERNPAENWVYSSGLDALFYQKVTVNSNTNPIAEYKNPLRLMTINNLDTAVVKTSDKTMKVTYTITRG